MEGKPQARATTRALYVRTSPGDNDGAAQLYQLRQWALGQGWPAQGAGVREYIDTGVSGTKDSRPEWDRLRGDVRAGRVAEVVSTELSRLGRSVLNVVLALDELHRAGCRVVLLRESLDYGTPVGRAVATILVAIAQLERERIVERVRSGVRRAQAEGTRSGRAIGRPRVKMTAEMVERARRKRALGCSWRDLAIDLGVSEGTVRRALASACQNPD